MTVGLTYDELLRYIDKTSGQVSRVRRTKSRIGKSLSGSVRRDEVLQNVQTFTEVRLDRKLDSTSRRICHKSTHAGKLLDLLVRTTGSGICHHMDVIVTTQSVKKCLSYLIVSILPNGDNIFITLLLSEKTSGEVPGDIFNLLLGVSQDLLLLGRNHHI